MRRKKCHILNCVLDTFPEHLKTKAKSMCDTLTIKDRLVILPSHEIIIDGEIDRGSSTRVYIMDSLIEPPIPGTPKSTMLEKENEKLKRNLACYEKTLARARGVSRCRQFESIIDGAVDRCDFNDDTYSDDGGNDDNDEKEDTDEDMDEYEEDGEPFTKKNRKWNWNFDLQLWKRYELNCHIDKWIWPITSLHLRSIISNINLIWG